MAHARTFSLRGSSRTGLLLATVLAVATGVAVYLALQPRSTSERAPAPVNETAMVVVAAQDIPAGAIISPGMVRLAPVDASGVLKGAVTVAEVAVGQVARIPIYEGEQLTAAKLSHEAARTALAFIVPPGMRAMAVKVDKVVGAGGNIRPGDRVDVLAVVEGSKVDPASGAESTVPFSMLVAENVEVLAVEQRLENRLPGAAPSEGTLTDQPEPDPEATVVTLALPPDVALRVLLAEQEGTIRLAVRPVGEAGSSSVVAVAATELVPTAAPKGR